MDESLAVALNGSETTSVITLLVFWSATAILLYTYVGYPGLIRLAARFAGRPVKKGTYMPTVLIVVAAYNEERSIAAKLENVRSLDYPHDKLKVVVASDGSSDRTDAIVTNHPDARVKLLRVEGRMGKTHCQNVAAQNSREEIIVFTDATTAIDKAALKALLQNFADPEVGCVAAQLVYLGKGSSLTAAGGTAYWSYEIGLRNGESALGSLIGVSGCLYAVRSAAYQPIRPDLISDFVIAMTMRQQNLRTVLEPSAVCFEDTLDRSSQELSMRIRVAIRTISALMSERKMLNPVRYGQFAFQLLSHKVLRYLSPFVWFVELLACATLSSRPLYLILSLLQVLFIACGLAGFPLQARGSRLGMLGKPYYFLLTNVASLLAVLKYVSGERITVWKPVRN